jgi:hypothetical protein
MLLERYERAEEILRECRETFLDVSPRSIDIAVTTGLLGRAIGEQGRFAEGEPMVVDACSDLEQRANLDRIRDAFANAVVFYEHWSARGGDVADELEEWRSKLAELPPEDE